MTSKRKSRREIEQAELREIVVREVGDALAGIALVKPGADGAEVLRLGISYLAACHAKNFGNVETIRVLIALSRRCVGFAEEELGLPTNGRELQPN